MKSERVSGSAFARVRSSVQTTEDSMLDGIDQADLETTRRVLRELTERARRLRTGS